MNARELVSDVWRDLVRRHGCDAASVEGTLEELVRAYAEPHRHYHTLDHIADLLFLLERHGGVSDAAAVKLAILFHDAVYDPARQDNEAVSANLAVKQLSALDFPRQLLGKVERHILATQHDVAPSGEGRCRSRHAARSRSVRAGSGTRSLSRLCESDQE